MTDHRDVPDDTPMADPGEDPEQLDTLWDDPPGLIGKLKAVQNDAIGVRLLATGFFFLLLGGSLDSLVMRAQLAFPNNELIGPELYNQLFTNHGSVTMFLVILPIFEGFAILLLPLLLGNREMPFPRLGAFAYWTFLMGGLLYYSSTLFSLVPDAGWFAYTPLSGPEFSPDLNIDFWVLGLGVAEIGAIAAGVEIIIGIFKMRTPGMSLSRLPLFAWSILVMAVMILFAFTPLIVGSLLLELDRGFGTQFFNVEAGGSSLLWQHLFWIFGHPEVYIQFLPATGIVSMIVPVFARRRMIGYPWIVASMISIGFLSFALWVHHMFAVGLPTLVLAFFSAASMVIAIPAGVQFFAWLATIWEGKRQKMKTPFLFVIGFLIIFLIGGVTGVMVASVPFDIAAHDSYFVVAHLHYVLIGGVAFPIFAGIYYWFPKFTGKMLNERLGKWNFWLMFIGVNMAFFPMHIVGLMGMPRRIYTYPEGLGWGPYNLVSTIGAFIVFGGIGFFILNVFRSFRSGEEAGPNPWGADSLEWSTPSPPLQHGYSTPPVVRSRHPLWDQEDFDSPDPRTEALVEDLSAWPLRWRAAFITRTTDGSPEEVFRVNGPSLWPLVTAFGVVAIFIAELTKIRPAALAGALVVLVGVIGWNWPSDPPITEEEERAFEEKHGIPVHAGGSPTLARWGMGMMIGFVSIGFSSFLLAYFYLRLDDELWPPSGVPLPRLWVAAVAVAAIVSAVLASRLALRSIQADSKSGLVAWMVGNLSLGLFAGYILGSDLVGLEFSSMDHAYGSIFHAIGWFEMALLFAATVMSALTIWWALADRYTPRRHVTVTTVSSFWIAVSVMWTIGLFVIYAVPHLT